MSVFGASIVLTSERSKYTRWTLATRKYGTGLAVADFLFLSTVIPPLRVAIASNRAQTHVSGNLGRFARLQLSGFFVFPSAFPLATAFGEDAGEEFGGGFDVGVGFAPVFGELAFDGGFEDGGFVAFEVGLDAFKIGDGFVEAGELFFDLLDDAILLGT